MHPRDRNEVAARLRPASARDRPSSAASSQFVHSRDGRARARRPPGSTSPRRRPGCGEQRAVRLSACRAGVDAEIQSRAGFSSSGCRSCCCWLWAVAGAVRHVVFLFLVAALIALLLNPLVRGADRVWIPRGFAVAIVYVASLGSRRRRPRDRRPSSSTRRNRPRIASTPTLRTSTDSHRRPMPTATSTGCSPGSTTTGLSGSRSASRATTSSTTSAAKDVQNYTVEGHQLRRGRGDRHAEAALQPRPRDRGLDLHAARHAAAGARRSTGASRPDPGSPPLLPRIEHSLAGYVKGQFLLSLIIGTSAGLGLWLLGTFGLAPGRGHVRRALRRVGRDHRADPVPRAVARRDPAAPLRARRASGLGDLGRPALPRHPPDRGPRRRAERDGQRASAASAARDLRPARRAARSTGCPVRLSRCRCSRRRGRSWEFFSEPGTLRVVAGRPAQFRWRWRPTRRPRPPVPARRTRRPQRAGERRATASRGARRGAAASASTPRSSPPTRDLRGRGARARRPERRRQVDAAGAARRGTRAEHRRGRARGQGVRVGWAPQRPAQYGRLSARENIELFARLEGEADPAGAAGQLLARVRPPRRASARSAHLSVGNRQRLNLAIALLGSPTSCSSTSPPPRSTPASGAGSGSAVDGLREARRRRRLRDAEPRRGRGEADAVAALRDGRIVFSGTVEEYDRAQADTLFA